MFFVLLPFILALQLQAFAFGHENDPAPASLKPASISELEKARLAAMQDVIACGVSKIENTDQVEPKRSECQKQIDAYNAISARYLEARGAQQ